MRPNMERLEKKEHESGVHSVIPGRCVRLSGEAARVSIPHHASGGQPHIELIREGEVLQAIEITCPCGQHIRLRCVY